MDEDTLSLVLIEAAERGPDVLAAVKDYIAKHPDALHPPAEEHVA